MRSSDDDAKFGTVMRALAAVFRQEVTPAMLEGYWMGVGDLTVDELERGARRAIRECRFMPVPAEIRELAGRGKDRRPYHEEHRALPGAERKQIAASWSRQLGAHSEPTEAKAVVGELVRRMRK